MHCIWLFGLFILFKSVTILPLFVVVVSHSIFLKSPDQLYYRMFHILDFSDCVSCLDSDETHLARVLHRDFPGGAVVKNPPANAGNMGSIPGPGRSHMLWSN